MKENTICKVIKYTDESWKFRIGMIATEVEIMPLLNEDLSVMGVHIIFMTDGEVTERINAIKDETTQETSQVYGTSDANSHLEFKFTWSDWAVSIEITSLTTEEAEAGV